MVLPIAPRLRRGGYSNCSSFAALLVDRWLESSHGDLSRYVVEFHKPEEEQDCKNVTKRMATKGGATNMLWYRKEGSQMELVALLGFR